MRQCLTCFDFAYNSLLKKGLPIFLGIEIKAIDPREVRTKDGPGIHGPPILDRVHAPLKKIYIYKVNRNEQ